jgi:O-acetylserine/cysteine efflux transporter
LGVLTMQAWIAAVTAPGMWLLTVLLERGQLTALQQATWLDYAAPTYSAVGSSLVGHGIVYWLLGRHPVALISTLMLLAPVLAVVLGVWLWGDQLSWELVLGGVLTLAGVAAVLARPRGPRPSGSGAGQQ